MVYPEANGPYSLGVYIGIPVTALLVLAALGIGFFLWICRERWYAAGAVGVALVIVGIFGVCWWPWDMDYHRWHERRGVIEQAEQRLLGSGQSIDQVFVIKFRGDPTLYRCDDTRCALAKPGKEIRLLCKPVAEFAAVDGWQCKYGQEA